MIGMRVPIRLIFAMILPLLPGAVAAAVGVFDVSGRAPERAIVTVGPTLTEPKPDEAAIPMLREIGGIIAVLDKPQIVLLRAAGTGGGPAIKPDADLPGEAARVCFVQLFAGDKHRTIEVRRGTDGSFIAMKDPADPQSRPVRLNRAKFEQLGMDWDRYRGDFTVREDGVGGPPTIKPGDAVELSHPYVAGWIAIDQESLGERLQAGRKATLSPPKRELDKETFLLRLPKGWTPHAYVGLLVWVDAGPRATLHEPLRAACDELGLILIGAADTGNNRLSPERYQLALDCVATAGARFLIDPSRVYVSGISGGGKIATHLWAGFPEIFTGSAPIVGLGSYIALPGDALGTRAYAPDYTKPPTRRLKLLEEHRCAAITGVRDFNNPLIKGMAAEMERDKLPVRVFEFDEMGHELPKADQFAQAMRWVDEKPLAARKATDAAGEQAWAKLSGLDAPKPGTPARRSALIEITRSAPWTPAAWRAADELGIAKNPRPKVD